MCVGGILAGLVQAKTDQESTSNYLNFIVNCDIKLDQS